MSKETVISEQELDLLKSHGKVCICVSCKDFKKKIVLLGYTQGKERRIMNGLCKTCLDEINSCDTCSKNSRN